jgi:hypothetical protein
MCFKKSSGSSVAGNDVTTITAKDTQAITLLYGQISLTTDATVANRRVVIGVYDDSGNLIIDIHSGAVVAASASAQHHELMQGVYRETSFVGGALQVPIPDDLIIPPQYSLKITVENGVAGDSYDYSLAFSVDFVVPGQTVVS